MTRQLGSALAAERQRATGDARAAERARIAREVHDAISQHLFGLRMIAAGMCRADPGNQQARAIERITEDALRDMQALLTELRPASLDGAGLAPALQEICAAYHDRLGVSVDASLDDVTVPAPVEHALLPTPSGTAAPAGSPCRWPARTGTSSWPSATPAPASTRPLRTPAPGWPTSVTGSPGWPSSAWPSP
jgi:Histidine kinase